MTETNKKKLPIAQLIVERVDSCKLIPGQRYTFYRNSMKPIRGTFSSYDHLKQIPTGSFIITHYSTSKHHRHASFSLFKYYVHYILKLYVNFQCLPKELNDIINGYY